MFSSEFTLVFAFIAGVVEMHGLAWPWSSEIMAAAILSLECVSN